MSRLMHQAKPKVTTHVTSSEEKSGSSGVCADADNHALRCATYCGQQVPSTHTVPQHARWAAQHSLLHLFLGERHFYELVVLVGRPTERAVMVGQV